MNNNKNIEYPIQISTPDGKGGYRILNNYEFRAIAKSVLGLSAGFTLTANEMDLIGIFEARGYIIMT